MQVGTGWWLSRLHQCLTLTNVGSLFFFAVLRCYLQHKFFFLCFFSYLLHICNTVTNSTRIHQIACFRMWQFFGKKIIDFVRRRAWWGLNPCFCVAGKVFVRRFTPTADVRTVVITLLQSTDQREVWFLFVFSSFLQEPKIVSVIYKKPKHLLKSITATSPY